jgi:DNA-binding MarR family transcriptional regulator/N-acetylglutamate synthase-like GNAT family acetyltransferase
MTAASPELLVGPIRDASRRLVREFGFMRGTLAGTDLPPSAVHALVEIGARGSLTAAELCDILLLEKSSVSRMLRKLVESGELAEAASERDGRAKPLRLTPKGQATLAAIDAFAQNQARAALERLRPEAHRTVMDGLAAYADALAASRTERPIRDAAAVTIECGYRPGVIGRAVEMHARYYDRTVGFGRAFESKVAGGLAEFAGRLDNPRNGLWVAIRAGVVVGTVAIDGEDLGPGIAHLRWFIVEDGLRGAGIGRRLLAEAIGFCDRQGFAEIHLWTLRGLDAARRLYDAQGFTLVEEFSGRQWSKEAIEQRFVRRVGEVPRGEPLGTSPRCDGAG